MISGEWYNPTRVIFGPGSVSRVADLVAGRSVLLHYGQKSVKESGLHGRITGALSAAGVRWVQLGGVVPNPRESLVSEGIRACREHGLEMVLAVGGGSVIDSAKAIAAGAVYYGNVRHFVDGTSRPERSLPVGVVLTVPGAGSETNSGALISFGDRKLGCSSDLLFPEWAVLDPELTVWLPPELTSSGIVDAMTHVLERYFTATPYVDCTDRICESLLQTLCRCAVDIGRSRHDLNIRGEIMWCCKLAHDGTAGFGRKGDWAAHQIAHEIGAMFPEVAHGKLMAVIMPAWMRHVRKERPEKFDQLAERVPALEVERFSRFLRQIGMPSCLVEMGIGASCVDEVVSRCAAINPSKTIGNYVRLGPDDVREIVWEVR